MPRELLTGLGPTAGNPDLVKIEHLVQRHDVPERGTTRPNVAEHARIPPSQIAGVNGGHGTGPAGRDQGGVDDRQRHAGARVVERQQPELAGQPGGVVGDEVTDHLGPGHTADRAAEHVEMPGAVVVGDEVHPRLDHRLPVAVGAHRVLHGGDDLGVGQAERADVRPGQEPEP